jgi:uncharacterized protein (DUF433 family)
MWSVDEFAAGSVGLSLRVEWAQENGMDYSTHIVRDPRVCGGQPVIRGTRVLLATVLASLAEGDSPDEILADFPTLAREHIDAVIAFAAASAREDLPIPGVPSLK